MKTFLCNEIASCWIIFTKIIIFCISSLNINLTLSLHVYISIPFVIFVLVNEFLWHNYGCKQCLQIQCIGWLLRCEFSLGVFQCLVKSAISKLLNYKCLYLLLDVSPQNVCQLIVDFFVCRWFIHLHIIFYGSFLVEKCKSLMVYESPNNFHQFIIVF